MFMAVFAGATNRVSAIDPALLRPGRFDRLVLVGPPNEAGRLDVLRLHARRLPLGDAVDLAPIAASCEGFTGADLASVVVRCRTTLQHTPPL